MAARQAKIRDEHERMALTLQPEQSPAHDDPEQQAGGLAEQLRELVDLRQHWPSELCAQRPQSAAKRLS